MTRFLVAAGALVAIAGGVAAVLVLTLGSGGGSSSGPTPAAYIARVSAVCQRYSSKLDRIPPPFDPTAYGQVVSSAGRALAVLRAEAAEIRAIRPPSSLEARVNRLFELNRRSLDELARTLAAAKRHDLPAIRSGLDRFAAARTRAQTLSRAIGFRCDLRSRA